MVQGLRPYTHSAWSLGIIRNMVVGIIEGQQLVQEEPFIISNKRPVNSDSATFTFSQKDQQPVHNLRLWYSDLSMIGRHFLVYSQTHPMVKRHYTICSTMGEVVLNEIEMCKNAVL